MAAAGKDTKDNPAEASRLHEAASVALAKYIGSNDFLDGIVRSSVNYAVADVTAGEIVIDTRAFLHGLLLTAQRTPSMRLDWLVSWADVLGWSASSVEDQADAVWLLYVGGGEIVPSSSLRTTIFPNAAIDLRDEALSLDRLLAVLLHKNAGWEKIGIRPKQSDFEVARQMHQSRTGESAPAPTDSHPASESLSTQNDDPASEDRLGRIPFAQVLAERIREARAHEEAQPGRSRAFMVHLHGPWGSGKSSILRFLRRELAQADPAWVTIDFNAWQNQSLRPYWWSIINEVRRQAAPQVDARTRRRMAATWWLWKLRADLLPVLLAAVLLAVAGLGLFGTTLTADKAVPLIAAFIAAGGAVFALSRTVVFGSSHAARAYAELKSDPYTPVIRLFGKLVDAIGRPLLVCVDDVDRCDSASVVDLLEGIQTLLRDAPVTYAIAGDRKWICASFEKRYDDFNERIGGPGRPLGYLFLDKMFQISTAVPRMSKIVRERYWDSLLNGGPAPATPEAAAQDLTHVVTQEGLQTVIDRAERPEEREALRAAAALQIARPAARSVAEHRFRTFGALLERNPRSMKLMINALCINQALAFLEGRKATPEALARWTILELRWPLLADWLSAHPDGGDCPLAALLDDHEVKAVMGDGQALGRLDAEVLKALHE